MLHDWAAAWYGRHEGELASEGVPFPLRIGHRTYWVTSEQALAAVSRTVQELDAALAEHPTWGSDARGRPCDLAMRGLINRRLAARVLDQVRRASGVAAESLSAPLPGMPDADLTLGDTVAGPSDVTGAESRTWLSQVLAIEPRLTREVIMRRIVGESSEQISTKLGLTDAATRQRISRFRRRNARDFLDAA
jgi:hypothetical protein